MTFLLFALAALTIAAVVYGAVMLGGLRLTKQTLEEEEPQLAERVDDDQLDGLPTDARF